MRILLEKIVQNDRLHALWLNTLSYLENCGARKIAACEHPTFVKEEMLKHAEEEFRHAYHLKRQIEKIAKDSCEDYTQILGGLATKHYLPCLDTQICRYLKKEGLFQRDLAYHLITYVIERRALELYPLYEAVLRSSCSLVTVRSLILEEHNHLQEMEAKLETLAPKHRNQALEFEKLLYLRWQNALTLQQLFPY